MLKELNAQFAVPDHLTFAPDQGGLAAAIIRNAHATATVALHGAHVLSFQPHGAQPVLWVSRNAVFQAGKAIRGGIPVCWPWFGKHPVDPAQPFHGFARILAWDVAGTRGLADGATEIELKLGDSVQTRAYWPEAFDARMRITVGRQLGVALRVRNAGRGPLSCTAALHTYFAVGAADAINVRGLEGCRYIDTVPQPHAEYVQSGPIRIAGETDRVYLDTTADCLIDDPVLKRRIRIAKEGSRSTVVWNPWIEKSKRMADFGPDEYRQMVYVETTNAESDARTIAPGAEHALVAIISVDGPG
jgi:glucose-6-phosphate 1-epimerase